MCVGGDRDLPVQRADRQVQALAHLLDRVGGERAVEQRGSLEAQVGDDLAVIAEAVEAGQLRVGSVGQLGHRGRHDRQLALLGQPANNAVAVDLAEQRVGPVDGAVGVEQRRGKARERFAERPRLDQLPGPPGGFGELRRGRRSPRPQAAAATAQGTGLVLGPQRQRRGAQPGGAHLVNALGLLDPCQQVGAEIAELNACRHQIAGGL